MGITIELWVSIIFGTTILYNIFFQIFKFVFFQKSRERVGFTLTIPYDAVIFMVNLNMNYAALIVYTYQKSHITLFSPSHLSNLSELRKFKFFGNMWRKWWRITCHTSINTLNYVQNFTCYFIYLLCGISFFLQMHLEF